jgi:hypothetical protein
MTNEELEKEIALWKRATGYDDPEDLDFFLGRAGVLNQFDVLNKMLADANKEKEQLRALLGETRPFLAIHAWDNERSCCFNCGEKDYSVTADDCKEAPDYELAKKIDEVLNCLNTK